MGTEFFRLRRKNAVWRLLRALMIGLAAGLLVAGGMMALLKLTSTDGRMGFCLGVGSGVFLVVAVMRWLMLRRSDLRAAEQMDLEHSLRERVQTMVAFQGEDSAMLQMQRQDTEEKLKAIRSYGVKKGNVAACICALVLAVAVLLTGIVLPARAEVEIPEEPEPEYNVTAWQLASLEDLIVHVQESYMAQPAKDQTVTQLQNLRQTLDGSITVSAFKAVIIETIRNVFTYTDLVNSNDDLHDVIRGVDHEVAGEIAYVAGSLGNVELGADVEDIGYQLGKAELLPTIGTLADELDEQLDRISNGFLVEGGYTETDALYQAMLHFAAGLHDLDGLIAAEDAPEIIQARLGEVVHLLKSEVNLALEQQTLTKEECLYVVDQLCSIFAISPNECPADPDPKYSKEDDEDFTEVGGGKGDGEMQYAGDEQVYDYKKDEHVSYTELVTEYYMAMLQANQEGNLPEEVVEFIMKYFSQLYTG